VNDDLWGRLRKSHGQCHCKCGHCRGGHGGLEFGLTSNGKFANVKL
jgi:hypothetical protein